MKKLSRILSSVLAVCMLISCFSINAFATTQARTYTVKTNKEGIALKAGDTVTVEVIADTLLHAANAGYYVYFDPEVFTIETASGGMGKPRKYIDTTWYNTMNDSGQVVGWYWGTTRTANQSAEEGWIMCSWGGNTDAGAGVEAENNQTNYTIGKYYLIVKDNAKTGSTKITVDGATFGWQETSADPMTYVPATVTVGSSEPETQSIGVSASLDYIDGAKGIAIDVTNTDNGKTVTKTAELGEAVIEKAGTIKTGLNIVNIPSDAVLDDLVKVLQAVARLTF